jgi:hypothetical protein
MGGASVAYSRAALEALRAEFFPGGIVREAAGLRLLDRVAPHGRLPDAASVALLMAVLEIAAEVPASLPTFLLAQLRDAIIAGEGPAIGPRRHFSRTIDGGDVKLIRSVLDAAAGRGGKPVSRGEAEALFDLHDAAAGSDNDPRFDELFYRAVAQHLLAASGHPVPSRREALRESWTPANSLRSQEAAWLVQHIMRDGRPTTAELKLIALLGQESRDNALRRFVDFAA